MHIASLYPCACVCPYIQNHEEVVKTLITAQADVKAVDRDGDMAIHWAATKVSVNTDVLGAHMA